MEKLNLMHKDKKAQAWAMDLMVASVIFLIAIVIFYVYALNDPGEARENIEKMNYDGKIIGDSLLSEGYPKDWYGDDVVAPGILTKNKINETKLDRFYDLVNSDYEKTKRLFNTRYEYYFSLNATSGADCIPLDVGAGSVSGIGLDPLSSNPRNLIKITHFTVYKDRPVTAYIQIWE